MPAISIFCDTTSSTIATGVYIGTNVSLDLGQRFRINGADYAVSQPDLGPVGSARVIHVITAQAANGNIQGVPCLWFPPDAGSGPSC